MGDLKISTWNINSVRLRIDQVLKFLLQHQPDVLCLQEIKCREQQFPAKALAEAGWPHMAIAGQKGSHGVAAVSRRPLSRLPSHDFCRQGDARHVSVLVDGVEVHNFYVPAGGDEPDPAINPKFDHKLDFLDRMRAYFAMRAQENPDNRLVITGDLNVAPGEFDVWSHKQLLNVVSHTPVETDALNRVLASHDFLDLARHAMPEPARLFTWWSYRARDWRASNRGRRLDHIWVSPALATTSAGTGEGERFIIHDETRDWTKPSDHCAVTALLR
ncbi:MAG: exodeoxyribonuclease III [Maricaulaceae bacterium]